MFRYAQLNVRASSDILWEREVATAIGIGLKTVDVVISLNPQHVEDEKISRIIRAVEIAYGLVGAECCITTVQNKTAPVYGVIVLTSSSR